MVDEGGEEPDSDAVALGAGCEGGGVEAEGDGVGGGAEDGADEGVEVSDVVDEEAGRVSLGVGGGERGEHTYR